VEQRFDSVLSAARTGAEWAWAELYREHAPAVRGYLRARRAPDADDLLGEVFLQLARDLPGFEGDAGAFRAWVFTVAHHRLLDDIRKRRRRPQVEGVRVLEELDVGVGDAEADALTVLREQELAKLIARLSPDQQTVVLLRVIADLTVEQVASVIGKRPGAVKALQRRGLAALEREISTEGVTL
jgi:RNA polymerase sigma factor (sigma-70 family)